VCKSALRWIPDVVTDDSLVSYGSDADGLRPTESRPLHPTQRTIAEPSLNICVGPKADIAIGASYARTGWSGIATRRTEARRGASHYFFTVHVIVFSSQLPLALSQSALVFGASCANAGAETASRRPVMTAKLSVFMNVSYLLEHPKDARRPTYCKKMLKLRPRIHSPRKLW